MRSLYDIIRKGKFDGSLKVTPTHYFALRCTQLQKKKLIFDIDFCPTTAAERKTGGKVNYK